MPTYWGHLARVCLLDASAYQPMEPESKWYTLISKDLMHATRMYVLTNQRNSILAASVSEVRSNFLCSETTHTLNCRGTVTDILSARGVLHMST